MRRIILLLFLARQLKGETTGGKEKKHIANGNNEKQERKRLRMVKKVRMRRRSKSSGLCFFLPKLLTRMCLVSAAAATADRSPPTALAVSLLSCCSAVSAAIFTSISESIRISLSTYFLLHRDFFSHPFFLFLPLRGTFV